MAVTTEEFDLDAFAFPVPSVGGHFALCGFHFEGVEVVVTVNPVRLLYARGGSTAPAARGSVATSLTARGSTS